MTFSRTTLTLARVVYTCLPKVMIVMISVADSPRLRATCLTSGAQAFIRFVRLPEGDQVRSIPEPICDGSRAGGYFGMSMGSTAMR